MLNYLQKRQPHSQRQAPWSPRRIPLWTHPFLAKNQAPGVMWQAGCGSNPSDCWLPPSGLLWLASACCNLHVAPSGPSGLQWDIETKAARDIPRWLIDSRLLVSRCMSSFRGVAPCVHGPSNFSHNGPDFIWRCLHWWGGFLACPLIVQSYGHLHMPSITLWITSTWVWAWELCAE